MKVALVRVGIDTGSGGMHGPLFPDGTFDYVPIPDRFGVDPRTYGNTVGRHGRPLLEYFPRARRPRMAQQAMHYDPEFQTYTYGDPSMPKSGLRHLRRGDLLVFYGGFRGWDCETPPGLYLFGYFEVLTAGRAIDYEPDELHGLFGENFHVRHPRILAEQRDRLVLVKGSPASRLLTKAVRISERGQARTGRPLNIVSTEMRQVFGPFGGKLSIQRSPTRWVDPAYVARAADFVTALD